MKEIRYINVKQNEQDSKESKIARKATFKTQNIFEIQNISKTQNTSKSQNISYTQFYKHVQTCSNIMTRFDTILQTCSNLSMILWYDLIRFISMSRLVLRWIHDEITKNGSNLSEWQKVHHLTKSYSLDCCEQVERSKISCSWHQTSNSPIQQSTIFFNKIFIHFLTSAKFLYWNQPSFSNLEGASKCISQHH